MTVDEYLAAQPPAVRRSLELLRKRIKAAAPKATEGVSYRIPVFKQSGVLVGFAGFPGHCAFYPMSTTVMKGLSSQLKGHEVLGTTIHFEPGTTLPAGLVRKLVRARVAENESRKER